MTQLAIRQSGGANIVSIPKAILKTLGLHVGSYLELSIEGNKIILAPAGRELTLEELLAGTPKERLMVTDEDREWMGAKPVGEELL